LLFKGQVLLAKSMIYPVAESETRTPRDLLPAFYKQYELGEDGGQSSPHVKIEVTKKISLYFPNFPARRKAIFKHDVHHIVTGYTSTFKGETEIGAWEIGSGCRRYWAAFVLDMSGVMTGILFNFPGVYKAFVKGRRTRNLYSNSLIDAEVMNMPVAELRNKLLLTGYPENNYGNLTDMLLFAGLLLFGVIYATVSLLFLPFTLIYTFYILIGHEKGRRGE
jgi:hypothetical protein